MHLAFLLDLSGDKLEQLLAPGDDGQNKRKLALSNAVNVFKKKGQFHLLCVLIWLILS